jgi:hypothetical protein
MNQHWRAARVVRVNALLRADDQFVSKHARERTIVETRVAAVDAGVGKEAEPEDYRQQESKPHDKPSGRRVVHNINAGAGRGPGLASTGQRRDLVVEVFQ